MLFSPAPIIPGIVNDRTAVSSCPIKVLVLYTQAAFDANPDIENIAISGITSTKIALNRSKVSEQQLDIVLAGTQLLDTTEWVSTMSMAADVVSVASNAAIASYRTQFEADLVFILTPPTHIDFIGGVTKIADGATAVDSAFAVVEVNVVAGPSYTFAHEFGHLFGARHEGTDQCTSLGDDSGLPDAHGYHFSKYCNCLIVQKKQYATLVAVDCFTERKRIHNFSNPDVSYFNKKTGRVDKNNNAKILRDAACRIASYVVSNEIAVYISGDTEACPLGGVPLTAVTFEMDPLSNYIFKWEKSFDGNTWFDVSIGAGSIYYSGRAPETVGAYLYARLTVTGPTGGTYTAWHEIKSVEGPQCAQRPGGPVKVKPRSSPTESNVFNISPNPSSGKFIAYIDNSSDKTIGFSVFNKNGKLVYELPVHTCATDQYEVQVDISTLPSGVYFVKCLIDNEVLTQKMVVLN